MASKIKDINRELRPREKLKNQGPAALTNPELLAIMLRTGTQGKNAIDLAIEMLECDKKEISLNDMSVAQMQQKFKGIGEVKAIQILAAIEFGARRQKARNKEQKIMRADDIVNLLYDRVANLDEERCWAIYMRQNHKVIGEPMEISSGGWSAVVVDVRPIIREALIRKATCVAIAHNHPSGNNTPSESDRNVTRRMRDAARALDIQFVDHVILTYDPKLYFSFAEQGYM